MTAVFWSVVSVAGVVFDLEHVARVAVERDGIGPIAVGRDGDRPAVAVQGRLVGRISTLPPTERFPLPGPRLTMPPVADRDRAGEIGDVLGPLPVSVADEVVIVYVPVGSAWPLRVKPPPAP